MSKRHSRKFILEAIAFWNKQLKKLDESAREVSCIDTDKSTIVTVSINEFATWNNMIDSALRWLANTLKNIVSASAEFDPPINVDAQTFSVDARRNVKIGEAEISKLSVLETDRTNRSSKFVFEVEPKIDCELAEAIFTSKPTCMMLADEASQFIRQHKDQYADDHLASSRIHVSSWRRSDEQLDDSTAFSQLVSCK